MPSVVRIKEVDGWIGKIGEDVVISPELPPVTVNTARPTAGSGNRIRPGYRCRTGDHAILIVIVNAGGNVSGAVGSELTAECNRSTETAESGRCQ